MRRLVVLLVVVGISIQPALADDLNARQADVRQQLAAAAAEISQLNVQMASLERSVTDTQRRIERERAQVRLLARALYAQPDSLVATVFESTSISEALTRIADLTSAGDRAASTKRELDRDLMALSRQRVQLQSDHDRQAQLQQQLEDQYGKLVSQAVAQRVQSPMPPPAPLPPDP